MENENKISFILENTKTLSHEEHIEIYKIINTHDINYSKNKNGIFINLKILNNEIINDIYKYIQFSIITNKKLKKTETILNTKFLENKNNLSKIKNASPNVEKNKKKIPITTKINLKKNKKKYNQSQQKLIRNYKNIKNKVMLPLSISEKNDKPNNDEIFNNNNDDYLEFN